MKFKKYFLLIASLVGCVILQSAPVNNQRLLPAGLLENQSIAVNEGNILYLIYAYGSKTFMSEDAMGYDVIYENPLYDFNGMKKYVNPYLRMKNLRSADVFEKIVNPFETPENDFATLARCKKSYFGKSDDALFDYLKTAGKEFAAHYNRIADMANEDKTFENLETEDVPPSFNKRGSTALQRSLYYQGFNPEFCIPMTYGNKYGGMDFPPLNMTPSDADLKRAIFPRDVKKAFEYSLLNSTLFDTTNYANLCFNGIGTEKDPVRAALIFSDSIFWNATAQEISNPKNLKDFEWDARTYYLPLYAYMLYHGIGVKKDKDKCDAILKYAIYNECWKNFYCGWFVPRDFDFAIYCLELADNISPDLWVGKDPKDDFRQNIIFTPAQTLADIYSGKYNPEHTNQEKALFWKNRALQKKKHTAHK